MKYNFLLKTKAKEQWKRIGIERKAGIIVPLFSIWTKESSGIGEILDLKLLIDFAKKVGFKIIQLLPINDFVFSPYFVLSSFAIDPVYLSLKNLVKEKEFGSLRKKFSRKERVDWRIKKEKLKLLWKIFLNKKISEIDEKFEKENEWWLRDYSIFKVLKEKIKKDWQDWPEDLRKRKKGSLEKIEKKYKKEVLFQKWLQFMAFLQLKEVKNYAKENRVFLKGDVPWLLPKESADCWQNPQYFDLNFFAGAPPDNFSKEGQKWGLAPLVWKKILEDGFLYFKQKLKYQENFYDIFRIDHAIGLFKIWKVPLTKKAKDGFYEPKEEKEQEKLGRKILKEIIKSTKMLPCAEDLGNAPPFLSKVLLEFGIPGISVQRWQKNWKEGKFLKSPKYNLLSVATLSTHDTSLFLEWFENEAKKEEKTEFLKLLNLGKFSKKTLILKNLEFINYVPCIFSINLISEWLFLDNILKKSPSFYRINVPGKKLKKNWTFKLPISLEELLEHKINFQISEILSKTERK
jgi:4-alpha-glucanotransferase